MSDQPDPAARQLTVPRLLEILEQLPGSSAIFERTSQLLDRLLEPVRPAFPEPTPPVRECFLTIGMATYDDYDGVYFSLQALRLYHPEIAEDTAILVVDNNPGGPCSAALKKLEHQIPNYRYVPYGNRQGTAVRDLLFREANSRYVLAMDSHVLFAPGALARLVSFLKAHPESNDLWQGPLVYDDLVSLSTHFNPEWQDGMYGVWRYDDRAADPDGEPFEIPMQGLGVFACRKQAWPGFNPRFGGFGGEEGYIHEKIRRRGGTVFCLPFLRWVHRFDRPLGTRYAANWGDRIRNYCIAYDELGLDPAPMLAHFEQCLGPDVARPLAEAAQREIEGPFHVFDGVYQAGATSEAGKALGLEARIRSFPAIQTPFCEDIGRALTHRSIIEDAERLGLENVLILEAGFDGSPGSLKELRQMAGRMAEPEWPGCLIPGALAFGRASFARLLARIPSTASGAALWVRRNGDLDSYYAGLIGGSR
jgi:hypothetical protein